MQLCSVLCASVTQPGWEAVWGRMDIIYVWLSPFAVHQKLSHHLLISYTPTQNAFGVKRKDKGLGKQESINLQQKNESISMQAMK